MNHDDDGIIDGGEIAPDSSMVALLNSSEIDTQITTARKYPRSLKLFQRDVFEMVTLSEGIAAECIYAIKRGNKIIEGPSARFAEIVVSAWGNSRAGARVVSDRGDFVIAQGGFHDLQRNVCITYEVQRRIVDKEGRRFNVDMIGVTGNAASSIALRNAILKGVPKAFWAEHFITARKTAMGDVKTLPTRRALVFEELARFGISPEQCFALLGIPGEADIGLEHLVTLKGLITALKEGDTTPEDAFPPAHTSAAVRPARKSDKDAGAPPPPPPPAPPPAEATGQKEAEQPPPPPPPPAPAAADPRSDRPVVLATPSEIQHIKLRAQSANVNLTDLLASMGLTELDETLAFLTKEDFKLLKTKLS